MALTTDEYVRIFKALADKTRLKIYQLLTDTEVCACDILEHVEITQPTVSHHMKVLADCGLIHSRKSGSWMWYTLNKNKIADIQAFLEDVKQGVNRIESITGADSPNAMKD